MIDFEKLKLAYELADKYTKTTGNYCVIRTMFNTTIPCSFLLDGDPSIAMYGYTNLDAIISALQELTKPTKYKIGQKIWYKSFDEPAEGVIKAIYDSITFDDIPCYLYSIDGIGEFEEAYLYASEYELISHQFEYWRHLLEPHLNQFKSNECLHDYEDCDLYDEGGKLSMKRCVKCGKCTKKDCQHEPDENQYLSNPNKRRCRKCKEFY